MRQKIDENIVLLFKLFDSKQKRSCSTRTTHIYFINLLNNLLQTLGIPHRVEKFFARQRRVGERISCCKFCNNCTS